MPGLGFRDVTGEFLPPFWHLPHGKGGSHKMGPSPEPLSSQGGKICPSSSLKREDALTEMMEGG